MPCSLAPLLSRSIHPPERRMADEAPRMPPGGIPGRPRCPSAGALRESPYSNRFLGALDAGVRCLLFPTYWLLSRLLALQQTTAERQAQQGKRCPLHGLQVLTVGPVLLLLLLLCLPASLLAFLVWLPLQTARRPFAYQHTPGRAQPEEWVLPGKDKAFSFVTSNTCLLPEGLAKFSNLAHTQWRAKHIAQELTRAARHPCALLHKPTSAEGCGTPGQKNYGAMESSPPRAYQSLPRGDADLTIEFLQEEEEGKGPALGDITARFPPGVDFLCLQEVFDARAATRVRRLLAPCYEHIIYDVGVYGLVGCSSLKLLNSGLFLASRYPVLAAQYHCYPNATGEDAFCAKGLLCVQVQLGASQGQRIVGYLNCTHMHAPEADAQVRYDQLSLGLLWAQLFQDAHAQPRDVVAFDVYCGDLNFDNCSSGDELEQGHEIFSLYIDPCRVGPRKDKPWAIGTLMDYLEIYQEAVATPENMKRTLEQPSGREKYLAGPVLANGDPDPSATSSEGRRIDYILYREHAGPVELKTAVEKVFFITQLATCSDHLPVGLRLLLTSSARPDA